MALQRFKMTFPDGREHVFAGHGRWVVCLHHSEETLKQWGRSGPAHWFRLYQGVKRKETAEANAAELRARIIGRTDAYYDEVAVVEATEDVDA